MQVDIIWKDRSESTYDEVHSVHMGNPEGWVVLYVNKGHSVIYFNDNEVFSLTIPDLPLPPPREETLPEEAAEEQE